MLNTKSVDLSNLDKKENSQVINSNQGNIKDIKLINKSKVPISVGINLLSSNLSKTLTKLNKNQTTESSTHTNETQMNKVTPKISYLKDNQIKFRTKTTHSKSDGKQFSNLFLNNTKNTSTIHNLNLHKDNKENKSKLENFKFLHNLVINIDQILDNKHKVSLKEVSDKATATNNQNKLKPNTPKVIPTNRVNFSITDNTKLGVLKSSLTVKTLNFKQMQKPKVQRNKDETIDLPNSTKSLMHIKNISKSSLINVGLLKVSKTKAYLKTDKNLKPQGKALIDSKKVLFTSTKVNKKKTIDSSSATQSKLSAFNSNKSIIQMNSHQSLNKQVDNINSNDSSKIKSIHNKTNSLEEKLVNLNNFSEGLSESSLISKKKTNFINDFKNMIRTHKAIHRKNSLKANKIKIDNDNLNYNSNKSEKKTVSNIFSDYTY